MKVLVTGGSGYIGSHVCVELLSQGHEIFVIDNYSNSYQEVLDRIRQITNLDFKFKKCDLNNREDIRTLFSENKFDAVSHFAGLKSVNESLNFPLKYFHNNISGTLNLLDSMIEFNVNKFVFSSSATVYGKPIDLPLTENSLLNPLSPYASSKLIVENMLKSISESNPEFKSISLRYFNPVGAHESGLIGENPKGKPNNVMPHLAEVAAGRIKEFRIYGDDYKTPDGTGIRDYIHVVDLARGHIAALEYLDSNNYLKCLSVNLGVGTGASVFELLKQYEKVAEKKIPYVVCDRRAGDLDSCYSDVSLAKEILGWTADYNLERMCRDSWNWILNNKLQH